MRIHGWNLVKGLLLVALSASLAWGQDPAAPWGGQGPIQQAPGYAPEPYGQGPFGYGEPCEYPPMGNYAAPGGYAPPGAYGGEPAYAPWPEVSPFDHRFDQISQERGLWMNHVNDSPRRWSAGVDWLVTWYQNPGGGGNEPDKQIGHPVRLFAEPSRVRQNFDEFGDLVLDGGALGLGTYVPQPPNRDPDRMIRWSFIEDDLDAKGVLGFIAFEDPDETGGELAGFWGGKADQEMDSPVQPNFSFATRPGDNSIIINRVRLSDGEVSSQPLVFQTSVEVRYEAWAYGAEANLITTPLIGRGSNRIRGIYGLRYMGTHERFDLVGIDNRPPYGFLTMREFNFLDTLGDSPIGVGADGYGGTTFVRTTVDSQLFGPQFGLRWDLGGEKLRLKTWAMGAPLANIDKTRIYTQNYGAVSPGPVPRPSQNVAIEEKHSHISPLVELGVQGDVPLFGYLPFVNRVPVVRDGILRVGYKYTAVFLMNRPADAITWGDPVPVIDSDREKWAMHGLNAGIHWDW